MQLFFLIGERARNTERRKREREVKQKECDVPSDSAAVLVKPFLYLLTIALIMFIEGGQLILHCQTLRLSVSPTSRGICN